MKCLIAALITCGVGGSVALDAGFVSAQAHHKLAGVQIRRKLAGMQMTDEVHYRLVYDRNGTLRSYALGTKKIGNWVVEGDQLCLYLKDSEDGCYEVWLSGNTFEMKPTGLGDTIDGIIQLPTDN